MVKINKISDSLCSQASMNNKRNTHLVLVKVQTCSAGMKIMWQLLRKKTINLPQDPLISHCGGLNMLGMGNGTIRKYGFVGIGVALWRKCVTVKVGFEILLLAVWKSVFCIPSEQDAELSAPSPALCLPGCCHARPHYVKGLNL